MEDESIQCYLSNFEIRKSSTNFGKVDQIRIILEIKDQICSGIYVEYEYVGATTTFQNIVTETARQAVIAGATIKTITRLRSRPTPRSWSCSRAYR